MVRNLLEVPVFITPGSPLRRVTILVRIAETGGVVDKKETKTKKFPLCFSKLNTLIFYYFGCKM